jgi:hypothetical protein
VTTPDGAVQTRKGRMYHHPALAGRLVPSVTTVVRALDRPGLNSWRVKATAAYAVEHAEWVVEQAAADPAAVIDHLRFEGIRQAVRAAVRGTRVHHIAQTIAAGNPAPPHSAEEAAYVASYLAFLDDRQPEFLATETTVYSTTHAYAGTLDLLARIDRAVVLGDIKTKNDPPEGVAVAVYPEVALQLSALAHADLITGPGGTTAPMPPVDTAVALHLSPTGYRLHPVDIDGWVWEAFLGLRAAWTFYEYGSRAVLPTAEPTAVLPARGHLDTRPDPTHPDLTSPRRRSRRGRPAATTAERQPA